MKNGAKPLERNILYFEEFLQLCRDADGLLDSLKHDPRLQGRTRRNLKPAAIHYLARKKGYHITLQDRMI